MGDVFYNKAVTVYNKYADGVMEKETWFPTVLNNVRLLITKGANISTSGMETADSAKLFVRPEYLPEGKTYLEPLKWGAIPDDEKYGYVTFAADDFFVGGDTTNEDSTQPGFFQYMKSRYDNCFRITNTDSYELIPHWEVGGK